MQQLQLQSQLQVRQSSVREQLSQILKSSVRRQPTARRLEKLDRLSELYNLPIGCWQTANTNEHQTNELAHNWSVWKHLFVTLIVATLRHLIATWFAYTYTDRWPVRSQLKWTNQHDWLWSDSYVQFTAQHSTAEHSTLFETDPSRAC